MGPTIRAQLRRGVPADMVIMSWEGLAELRAEDRIAIGSDVDLGRVPLGVGVRAGTSHPNIATVDAFNAGAADVAAGGAEMIVLPVSEILPYPGVDFVGTISRRASVRPGVRCRCGKRCEGSGSSPKAHRFPRIRQGNSFDRKNGDEADASALSYRSRRQERSLSPQIDSDDAGDLLAHDPRARRSCGGGVGEVPEPLGPQPKG
jgi:hypothetical protein